MAFCGPATVPHEHLLWAYGGVVHLWHFLHINLNWNADPFPVFSREGHLHTWEFVTWASASNCSSVTSNISFCSLNLRAAILTQTVASVSPGEVTFLSWVKMSVLHLTNSQFWPFSQYKSCTHFWQARRPKKCGSHRQPTPLTSSCAALHCAGAHSLKHFVYSFSSSKIVVGANYPGINCQNGLEKDWFCVYSSKVIIASFAILSECDRQYVLIDVCSPGSVFKAMLRSSLPSQALPYGQPSEYRLTIYR